MRRALGATLIAVAVAGPACRPDTVELAYRFPAGSTLTYEMIATVHANWDIGTEGEGSYRVAFDITEEVVSVNEDGAVVTLDLARTSVEQDNFTPPSDSSFTVRVDEQGAVREVVEVEGVAANLLLPEQKSLVLTYRPLLALQPVSLHEYWPASQAYEGEQFQALEVVGRLEKLDRDDQGDFAGLSYTGSGPLIGSRELPEGNAELSGSTRTEGEAIVDLNDGILRTASSSTSYEFDVNVVPRDATNPISGTLEIEQDLELTKVSEQTE